MSSILIEQELTDNTLEALFKYARQIIRIHLRAMAAGERPTAA